MIAWRAVGNTAVIHKHIKEAYIMIDVLWTIVKIFSSIIPNSAEKPLLFWDFRQFLSNNIYV